MDTEATRSKGTVATELCRLCSACSGKDTEGMGSGTM
jgi:hypothetical protein